MWIDQQKSKSVLKVWSCLTHGWHIDTLVIWFTDPHQLRMLVLALNASKRVLEILKPSNLKHTPQYQMCQGTSISKLHQNHDIPFLFPIHTRVYRTHVRLRYVWWLVLKIIIIIMCPCYYYHRYWCYPFSLHQVHHHYKRETLFPCCLRSQSNIGVK